ncbi:hypothetical protein Cgig2_022943 [Carnegiea gigantea]|uniref:PRA1 family protein n=1 Tax=Carnegiea gigantea TaxID=171969 RepID=A0A9Q1QFR5_9CARY|nr:hypothetical protein Cgig2_022943 [Carnegiea gigantea]
MAAAPSPYAPIPTASTNATNLDYISRAKQRLYGTLAMRRPWKQIFDYHAISLPHNFGDAISRLKTNLSYFRMNFAMVILLILFLSLLWHPISLIVFIVMMAAATLNIILSVVIGLVIVAIYSIFRRTDDLFLDEEAAAAGGLLSGRPGFGPGSYPLPSSSTSG